MTYLELSYFPLGLLPSPLLGRRTLLVLFLYDVQCRLLVPVHGMQGLVGGHQHIVHSVPIQSGPCRNDFSRSYPSLVTALRLHILLEIAEIHVDLEGIPHVNFLQATWVRIQGFLPYLG